MNDKKIRPVAADDMVSLLAIERQCHKHPWTLQQFAEEMANPLASIDLLLMGADLAGFHCYWHFSSEMHILNIATAPLFRRRNVARDLLHHSIKKCLESDLERVFLEVRRQNDAAIRLYYSLGFVTVGCRRGYYADGEDALVMELTGKNLTAFRGNQP